MIGFLVWCKASDQEDLETLIEERSRRMRAVFAEFVDFAEDDNIIRKGEWDFLNKNALKFMASVSRHLKSVDNYY